MRGTGGTQGVSGRLYSGGGDGLDKELVDAAIVREFGMEGGGQDAALANQRGEAVALGEDLDAGTVLDDARSADEDHLQRAAGEAVCGGDDGRVDLAAVGVALDDCIEQPQASAAAG